MIQYNKVKSSALLLLRLEKCPNLDTNSPCVCHSPDWMRGCHSRAGGGGGAVSSGATNTYMSRSRRSPPLLSTGHLLSVSTDSSAPQFQERVWTTSSSRGLKRLLPGVIFKVKSRKRRRGTVHPSAY